MESSVKPRPTVIVVDDDADLLTALRYMLEIEGFEVITCPTGEDLLDLSLPASSACLVVDQRLPGISGIKALEALRDRQVELPAVVITTSPDAKLRGQALMANARLIEKPLLNDLLTSVIRELI
jgi:FixJ family two-component response regulator